MRRSTVSLSLAALMVLGWPATAMAAIDPGLGTAGSFAVLAGTTVTNTGPTLITGELGVFPGTSVIGFPPGASGAQHIADSVATMAQTNLVSAFANAAQPCSTDETNLNLGGLTLDPGVYCQVTAPMLTGTLTLTGSGIYIFQIGSALVTAPGAQVSLINGAQACDVFWRVSSSATLGASTNFVGNIMALTSIAMQTGATLNGRALARNGSVTLDTNRIIQPGACGGVGQSISFAPLADKILGEPPFGVTATATSGLPVTFTASGQCSISGSTVSLTGVGVCTITAGQAGNDSFNAAPNVSQSFDVLSPAEFAQGMIDATSGMGLMSGIENSLTSKLRAYIDSTARGQGTAACGQLGAFVNDVGAQSGKQVRASDATILLDDAARLATASSC